MKLTDSEKQAAQIHFALMEAFVGYQNVQLKEAFDNLDIPEELKPTF